MSKVNGSQHRCCRLGLRARSRKHRLIRLRIAVGIEGVARDGGVPAGIANELPLLSLSMRVACCWSRRDHGAIAEGSAVVSGDHQVAAFQGVER